MKEIFVTPDDENVLNLLKKIKRFNEISEKDLRLVIKAGKFREYEPEETITKEGEFDSWAYFLLSGTLKIQKKGRDVDTLKRLGDVFGEMDSLGGTSGTTSVVAASKSIILAIDTSFANKQLQEEQLYFYYMIYRIFAETLAVRLRNQIENNDRLSTELTQKINPKIVKKSTSEVVEPSQDLSDKKILIVEHEAYTRRMLKSIIKKELKCNKIYEVSNGEQALTFLNEEDVVDLIIAELNLPQMSGLELLSNVKRLMSVNDVPFIILCSSSNINEIKQAPDDDITHYNTTQCILKPFTANIVIEKVKKIFLNMESSQPHK